MLSMICDFRLSYKATLRLVCNRTESFGSLHCVQDCLSYKPVSVKRPCDTASINVVVKGLPSHRLPWYNGWTIPIACGRYFLRVHVF